MATALLYLSASLLVFLILTEVITVSLNYDRLWMAKINFMIFAVQLSQSESSQKKKSSKKRRRRRPAILRLYKLIYRLGRRSDVYINTLAIKISSDNPYEYAITRGAYLSLLSAGAAALISAGRNFSYDNIIITNSEHNKTEVILDVKFKCSLISFLFFCISLVIDSRKGK